MNIVIDKEIRQKINCVKIVTIEARVVNSPSSPEICALLNDLAAEIRGHYPIDTINKRPGIAATRRAYKACGKEPNRYRPSAEALCRRMVKNAPLYFISTLVDIINIVSVKSGYSIGGFDIDKIHGDTLTLGIGHAGEPFEGIGRGPLNIEGMPVYRDRSGGVGTPTSDNERTKIDLSTRRLLICINIYGTEMPVDETIALTRSMLERYCSLSQFTTKEYNCP